MNCPRCGAQLVPESAICAACGNVLASRPEVPFNRPTVITVVAVFHFIGAAIGLLVATATLVGGSWSAYRDQVDVVVGLLIIVAALVFGAIGLLQLACGVGLLKLKPYGRTLQLVFAGIGLLGFPVGTIVSVLLLVYFRKPGITALFSGRPRSEMSVEELNQVAAVTRGPSSAIAVAITVVVAVVAAVALLGIAAAVAVPGLMRARISGNEASAVASLRAVNAAEANYASACAGGGFAVSLQDLARPPRGGAEGFVWPDLGTNGIEKSGYLIVLARDRADGVIDIGTAAATCNGSTTTPASGYFASAEPAAPGKSGTRYFATDSSGVVYVSGRPIANPIQPSASVVAIQ